MNSVKERGVLALLSFRKYKETAFFKKGQEARCHCEKTKEDTLCSVSYAIVELEYSTTSNKSCVFCVCTIHHGPLNIKA